MVKKILKLFAYFFFFLSVLILFSPKSSLYYLLESEISKYGVVISNEHLDEHAFYLNTLDLDLSLKGIPAAHIVEADISLYVLYNTLKCKDIYLSSFAQSYLPLKIESLSLSYTPLNPFVIKGNSQGEFGSASFEFHLQSREIQVSLSPSALMSKKHAKSLKYFKKSEKGEYIYAKTL